MAQPCKVFSYTNVGTEKGVLANIAGAAQAGGWTVDKNAVDAEGELYLHSTGGGNRQLYFCMARFRFPEKQPRSRPSSPWTQPTPRTTKTSATSCPKTTNAPSAASVPNCSRKRRNLL